MTTVPMSVPEKITADSAVRARLDRAERSDVPRPSSADVDELIDAVAELMDVLAGNAELASRVAIVKATVALVVTDAPQGSSASVGVSFADGRPALVAIDQDTADIRLYLDAGDLARVLVGDIELAILIAQGEAAYEGPVREVLRVMPIIRGALDRLGAPERYAAIARRLHVPAPAAAPTAEVEPGLSAAALLDRAVERAADDVHEAAAEFEEREPGEFWAIRCHGVTKAFGPNRVLQGLDFSIPEGLITVVLGPSGTGKSVLINHLIGLSFPDEGDVVVHGESLADMRRSRLNEKRKEFGVLFQDGALFGSMSMFDNVAFPLRQHTDLEEDEIEARVTARLAEVGLLNAMHRMPNELSGGMKKRAGFARALMLDPTIVLFDEPDSGLDPVRTGLLCKLIRETHQQHGGTYVVITHDIASARQVGQYIAVLWKGQIVQAGSAEQMLASPNPFVHQFLHRDLEGPLGME